MLYILCNNIPNIKCEKVLLNRLEFVEMKVRFTKSPSPDNPYEKLIDESLKTEIIQPRYINQFTKFFVDGACDVIRAGKQLFIPESALKASAKYKADIYPWIDFINEKCVEGDPIPNPAGGRPISLRVAKADLYKSFREWFEEVRKTDLGDSRFKSLPLKGDWSKVTAQRYASGATNGRDEYVGLRFQNSC